MSVKEGKKNHSQGNKQHLQLANVRPLTERQVELFASDKNLAALGAAGTGKTFCATAIALKSIMTYKDYDRLIYVRSVVPTRDMGFLPGTDKEKAEVYEAPYKEIAAELFNRGDAYELLKREGTIHFMTTSFLRGTTMRNAVIIVDECQNMSYHELDSIITRIGDNCRVIFCGDIFQADLQKNGIRKFFDVLESMDEFDFVEFGINDIVRGPLVKSYLQTKYQIHGQNDVE